MPSDFNLTIKNRATDENGDVPTLTITPNDHRYVSYFEDEHGLQHVFIYKFDTNESVLFEGVGEWNRTVVWQGVISDDFLDGAARIWLSVCLLAVKARLGKQES